MISVNLCKEHLNEAMSPTLDKELNSLIYQMHFTSSPTGAVIC